MAEASSTSCFWPRRTSVCTCSPQAAARAHTPKRRSTARRRAPVAVPCVAVQEHRVFLIFCLAFAKMKLVQDNRSGTSMFYPDLPDSMFDLSAPLVPRFTTAKKYNRNHRAHRPARRVVFQGKGFVFFEGELEKLFQPRAKGQFFELSEGDLAQLFQEEVDFNMVSHDEYLASLEYIEFEGFFNDKAVKAV